jgi:D-xylose transport system permease protein
LIGSALIYTIQSGMFIKGYATGIIYIVTGIILLLAVTFDTIVRRVQARSGR